MSEKQFCPKCEYYFFEMFTCPICYGEQKATERIIKLLESELGQGNPDFITERDTTIERLIALIKGENK